MARVPSLCVVEVNPRTVTKKPRPQETHDPIAPQFVAGGRKLQSYQPFASSSHSSHTQKNSCEPSTVATASSLCCLALDIYIWHRHYHASHSKSLTTTSDGSSAFCTTSLHENIGRWRWQQRRLLIFLFHIFLFSTTTTLTRIQFIGSARTTPVQLFQCAKQSCIVLRHDDGWWYSSWRCCCPWWLGLLCGLCCYTCHGRTQMLSWLWRGRRRHDVGSSIIARRTTTQQKIPVPASVNKESRWRPFHLLTMKKMNLLFTPTRWNAKFEN